MTIDQAESAKSEILKICHKYGLWYTVESEHRPGLSNIRIKEISIKITK